MRRHTFLPTLVAVAVSAATVAGCTAGGAATQPPPSGRSSAELETLYHARLDSARARHSEADAEFMTGMIAHHAQALVMAAMAPRNNAGPQVRTLAARIDNAQRDEIRWMQQWLRDRRRPVPEIHIEGTNPMDVTLREGDSPEAQQRDRAIHGAGAHDHHAHMPGMLTDDQIGQLDAARGEEFDRLFLLFMIQHHQGAVQMVDELFATDGAAQEAETFKVASDIQVDQRTEIARMQSMLDSMPAAGN